MRNYLLLSVLILSTTPVNIKNLQNFSTYSINAWSYKTSFLKSDCDIIPLFEKSEFPVGVAINFQKLMNEKRYRNIVISQFNSITAEKSMKAAIIHPEKDVYAFEETDYLMRFCQKYNKRLHGHTLVWHKEMPHWMEKFKGNRNEWELMLKNHIHTIISHCKANVKSWDVLNEAFNDNGSLRENIWLKHIGEEYIEKCFRYAAEADPDATLFYNDFDLESRPEKLDAVLKFLTTLKVKGVKIDGIGMQMHVSINAPYLTDINLSALKIEAQGFLVHYSEFDITLVKTGKLWMFNKHLLTLQAQRVKEIVAGYRKLHTTNRFGITMWGVSDDDSWLTEKNGNNRPLLFDSWYKIKPAYCGFLEGLAK
ncbi:MAG: endo-1,4-beta-xylanase [Bacteroidota bacterium]